MKNKKHIVFFARTSPLHHIGGMEIISFDLAKQFTKDGHRVTFITTNLENFDESFTYEGINIVALKNTKSKKYTKNWWIESKRYFEDNLSNTDVIISVSSGAFGIEIKNLTIPVIFQAHGTSFSEIKSKINSRNLKSFLSLPKNIFWLFKDLINYPKFAHIVATGEFVYRELEKFPYKNLNPKLIYNGIDSSLFMPTKVDKKLLGFEDDDYIIISVSRLHKQKGLELSLKSFAKLLTYKSKAKYIIIGDGKQKDELYKLVENLDIKDDVFFLGAKSREEIVKYLNIGDVFLFTTIHNEGMPLNVMEALSCGLPVVLSNHLKNRFKNSQELYFINPYNAEETAKKLLEKNKFNYSLLDDNLTLKKSASGYYKLFEEKNS